jgi:protoheme IX farnesyltransferase
LAAGVLRAFDFAVLAGAVVGSALVIACGCVYNNVLDRGIDRRMARTKKRALAQGKISVPVALTYGTVLGIAGFAVLALWTNPLTVLIGVAGLAAYVVLYGAAKRTTIHSTLIGSISGAIPPVAGYTALSGRLDGAAWILFVILTAWQMPHFYAIGMYRLQDYKNAGLPILPVVKGMRATKIQIVAYAAAFVIACALLTVFGYTGITYLVVTVGLGLWWFMKGMQGFKQGIDDVKWARKMFFYSLIITLTTAIMLSVGALLP